MKTVAEKRQRRPALRTALEASVEIHTITLAKNAIEELKDLCWINLLPQCPCSVGVENGLKYDWLIPPHGPWENDLSCNPDTDCSGTHPGAFGCIRALPDFGQYGQQCCYDNSGAYIATGEGAGTADKQMGNLANMYNHFVSDVAPFYSCCDLCEIASYCSYYIGSENQRGARQDIRGCGSSEAFTDELVKNAVLRKEYLFFTGSYNINLVGIRGPSRVADDS